MLLCLATASNAQPITQTQNTSPAPVFEGSPSKSQNPKPSTATWRYDEALQLWRNTQSAAGLAKDSTRNRGIAEFAFERNEGSYRRVQEGSSMNEYSFFTERYQHIGKYLYGYGSFRFTEGTTKNRAWSDVMRTYESTPYISGSAVPGRYDHQDFALTARVGTVSLGHWNLGLGLDYKVGDLSRLRDPRSRNRLLDYKITPAVAYSMGNHTVGVAGYYNRRKEKMPTLTTVQNIPNLYYYQMSGMEFASGTVNGYIGFSREYVNHAYGAEFEYGFRSEAFRSLNTLKMEKASDYIYEQYLRQPGRYNTYEFDFTSQNRFVTSSAIHELDVKAGITQGYADENRPQLVITTDPVHGYNSYHYENLMTFRKRYQYEAFDVEMRYRANFVKGQEVKKYVGVSAMLSGSTQKHKLPESQFDKRYVDINAEYGQGLLRNNRLWVMLDLGYHISSKTDLALADADSDYAKGVWLADMNYYKANAFKGMISVKYQFPLTVKKATSTWFVKGFAQTVKAQHSLDATTFGFSFGLIN